MRCRSGSGRWSGVRDLSRASPNYMQSETMTERFHTDDSYLRLLRLNFRSIC